LVKGPRDFSADVTVGIVRFARTFSNVVSPPTIFASLGLAVAWLEVGFWSGLLWAAVFGFWVSLAPILFVVYLLKTRRISDLHMNTPRERRLPYLVGVAGAVVALAIGQVARGPELLRCLALFSVIQLAALALINYFWLISIHTTSITAATLIVAILFGPLTGVAVGLLGVLVVMARLFLRRHTGAQVAAGAALGVVSVVLVRAIGCFTSA
jgi:hypothetical protein